VALEYWLNDRPATPEKEGANSSPKGKDKKLQSFLLEGFFIKKEADTCGTDFQATVW